MVMAGRKKGSMAKVLSCFLAASGLVMLVQADGLSDWNIMAETKEQAILQSVSIKSTLDGVQSGVGATAARSQQLLSSWWVSYKKAFGKQYANPAADQQAFRNFMFSLHAAVQVNTDPSIPFWQAPNQFSDLDYNTFKSHYLMSTPPDTSGIRNGRKMMGEEDIAVDLELHSHDRKLAGVGVNWNTSNRVTPIKDQGQCGSCWAFAATAAIESAYLIAYKLNPTYIGSGGTAVSTIDLAEQELVSCANSAAGYYSAGCNGGCSDYAMKFVVDKLQTTESLWKYTATTGTCNTALLAGMQNGQYVKLNPANAAPYPSVGYVPQLSEKAMMARANIQPFVVYIDVEASFQSYKQGVYTGPDCKKIAGYINHAVLLVGYYYSGKSDATSYWIIKNSWGTWWGEKGFIRIAMSGDGIGVCNVNYFGTYPALSFAKTLPLPTPPKPSPSPSPKPSPSPAPKTCSSACVQGCSAACKSAGPYMTTCTNSCPAACTTACTGVITGR